MYPQGEVVTCGSNAEGYFVILFKYGNVDELLINEIYGVIDNSAKEMGIQNIPVEFGYGTYSQKITLDSEQGIYHKFGESTENLSESDIHTIQEVMKEKPTTIEHKIVAAYGKIPLLKDQNEISAWANKLFTIYGSTQEKILPYMKSNKVIMYGAETTRMAVGINETLSPEEKATIIKEIYQIIDEEARKQNISDVSVLFDEGTFINEASNEDLGAVEDTVNSSTPGNINAVEPNNSSNNSESKNGNKPSKINSTPGFGLLVGLTCLYAEWKLRKK